MIVCTECTATVALTCCCYYVLCQWSSTGGFLSSDTNKWNCLREPSFVFQGAMVLRVCLLWFSFLCFTGFSHIITMDLHQKEVQGFFDCPVDNLRASDFLIQYVKESVRTAFNSLFFSWPHLLSAVTITDYLAQRNSRVLRRCLALLISMLMSSWEPETFWRSRCLVSLGIWSNIFICNNEVYLPNPLINIRY